MNILDRLPPPQKHKTGWPWTDGLQEDSDRAAEVKYFPKISIVTPSFNQGEFLEETIRSVLLQNYPNLEYIVIDGGSTDQSIEIIKKYQPWLSYWVSEPDRGQSHGINKGLKRATGDIYGWINSDDLLKPNSLFNIAKQIRQEKPDWLIGACEFITNSGKTTLIRYPNPKNLEFKMLLSWGKYWIPQPSVFWNKRMFNHVGLLNENLHYVMDVELWFRMVDVTAPQTTKATLSCFRKHENAKTTAQKEKSQEELINLITKKFLHHGQNVENNLLFLLRELLYAQSMEKKLENLNNHIVIGKVIKLWKTFINENLRTS